MQLQQCNLSRIQLVVKWPVLFNGFYNAISGFGFVCVCVRVREWFKLKVFTDMLSLSRSEEWVLCLYHPTAHTSASTWKRKSFLTSNPSMLRSLLAGGLRVAFIAERPGKRGVRNRRRHLGLARKSVWGEWQSDGEGGAPERFSCAFKMAPA